MFYIFKLYSKKSQIQDFDASIDTLDNYKSRTHNFKTIKLRNLEFLTIIDKAKKFKANKDVIGYIEQYIQQSKEVSVNENMLELEFIRI